MKPTLLILAAGMGSRYGGLKQVDPVGPEKEAIIDYSIYDAIRAGFGKVVFVIRQDIASDFKEKVSDKWKDKITVEHVFQAPGLGLPKDMSKAPKREKPWGTAHAVLAASKVINEPFAVINADDYYGIKAYQKMADFLTEKCTPEHYSMMGYVLERTLSDHGTVSRGICTMDAQNCLTTVTEHHKIRKENGQILFTDGDGRDKPLSEKSLVSMNFWGFHPAVMEVVAQDFKQYARENIDKPKAEFYIPFVINRMIQEEGLRLTVIPNDDQWFGVTYREDKPIVVDALSELVQKGKYPAPVWH